MEHLIRCSHPALIVAADHLIDLVDRVIERHTERLKEAAYIKWSPNFGNASFTLDSKCPTVA